MQQDRDVISNLKHPAVVAARQALRRPPGQGPASFLVDAHKMVAQAIAARAAIEAVFFLSPLQQAEQELMKEAERLALPSHRVTKGVFFRILGLGYETSVRVLAVVGRPRPAEPAARMDDNFCVLIGEGIQDPRNVGVLIRTADAWGLTAAIFSQDSADPYSRGSVRSSTGSIFRVPLAAATHVDQYARGLKSRGVRVIGTSARAATPCRKADLTGRVAFLLGNEGTGLTKESAGACDEIVAIPMIGGAHSLNVAVAAGIILYERSRQFPCDSR